MDGIAIEQYLLLQHRPLIILMFCISVLVFYRLNMPDNIDVIKWLNRKAT